MELVNGVLVAKAGRQEYEDCAACPGRNYDGIHVCAVGNFQETVPSQELYQFLAELSKGILARNPTIQVIGGHRDYYATACPGANFNVGIIENLIKEDKTLNGAEALKILKDRGVITDTEYWSKVSDIVKYQEQLYINMAKALTEGR